MSGWPVTGPVPRCNAVLMEASNTVVLSSTTARERMLSGRMKPVCCCSPGRAASPHSRFSQSSCRGLSPARPVASRPAPVAPPSSAEPSPASHRTTVTGCLKILAVCLMGGTSGLPALVLTAPSPGLTSWLLFCLPRPPPRP